MFDPNLPATDTDMVSAEMRSQFNGLKALIDAVPVLNTAEVDATTTLPQGDPATAAVSVIGSTLHFSFGMPEGPAGPQGNDGTPGGPEGPQGQPGEVSLTQLDNAIMSTSANTNGVSTLDSTFSDPPTTADLEALREKINELILNGRR